MTKLKQNLLSVFDKLSSRTTGSLTFQTVANVVRGCAAQLQFNPLQQQDAAEFMSSQFLSEFLNDIELQTVLGIHRKSHCLKCQTAETPEISTSTVLTIPAVRSNVRDCCFEYFRSDTCYGLTCDSCMDDHAIKKYITRVF